MAAVLLARHDGPPVSQETACEKKLTLLRVCIPLDALDLRRSASHINAVLTLLHFAHGKALTLPHFSGHLV